MQQIHVAEKRDTLSSIRSRVGSSLIVSTIRLDQTGPASSRARYRGRRQHIRHRAQKNRDAGQVEGPLPHDSSSPAALLSLSRRSPRLVLPNGDFDRASANSSLRGALHGAIVRLTLSLSSAARSGLALSPSRRKGFDHRPAHRVRTLDHGGFQHRGVAHQAVLHLDGRDPVAADPDRVIARPWNQ